MLLTATELATHLKTSVGSVYRQARRREIPSHTIGRLVRFDLHEVLQASARPVPQKKPQVTASHEIARARLLRFSRQPLVKGGR